MSWPSVVETNIEIPNFLPCAPESYYLLLTVTVPTSSHLIPCHFPYTSVTQEVSFPLLPANNSSRCAYFIICSCFWVSQNPASLFKLLQYTDFDSALHKKRHATFIDISKSPISHFIFYRLLIFKSLGWISHFQKVIIWVFIATQKCALKMAHKENLGLVKWLSR